MGRRSRCGHTSPDPSMDDMVDHPSGVVLGLNCKYMSLCIFHI